MNDQELRDVVRPQIATRLLKLRRELHRSQREQAIRYGVKPITLRRYERGEAWPLFDFLLRVALDNNVTLDWLCGLSDSRYADEPVVAEVSA